MKLKIKRKKKAALSTKTTAYLVIAGVVWAGLTCITQTVDILNVLLGTTAILLAIVIAHSNREGEKIMVSDD